MKQTVLSLLTLTLIGCATFQSGTRTFDQAVIESINPDDERGMIVIVVDKKGALTLAGRLTSLQELEGIRHVVGLPEEHPQVLIRGHEASHGDIRAVMGALEKGGIWRISIAVIQETDESQNNTSEGIRR